MFCYYVVEIAQLIAMLMIFTDGRVMLLRPLCWVRCLEAVCYAAERYTHWNPCVKDRQGTMLACRPTAICVSEVVPPMWLHLCLMWAQSGDAAAAAAAALSRIHLSVCSADLQYSTRLTLCLTCPAVASSGRSVSRPTSKIERWGNRHLRTAVPFFTTKIGLLEKYK